MDGEGRVGVGSKRPFVHDRKVRALHLQTLANQQWKENVKQRGKLDIDSVICAEIQKR
jgi:hypothetical protein